MNIANENSFTCSQFRKNLRAFIDNELPVNIKALFLEHVAKCPICNRALKEMQSLKKRLTSLDRISVTPEFDFRLKSSLRQEHEKKHSPGFSGRMLNFPNMSKFLMMTAGAAVIVAGFAFMYNNSDDAHISQALPEVVRTHVDSYEGVEMVPESDGSSIDEVNFVLETVKPSDVEKGIFQENPDGSVTIPEKTNNMTLISY